MRTSYDVVIIGGGIVGCAVLYTLTNFTNVKSVVLLEKNTNVGQENSNKKRNSKTLHEGFAETNYSFEKMVRMRLAASLIKNYIIKKFGKIPRIFSGEKSFCFSLPFLVLALDDEIDFLEKKYEQIRKVFPDVRLLQKQEIEKLEPNLVKERSKDQAILALFKQDGTVIDFGALAQELLQDSISTSNSHILFNQKVKSINEKGDQIEVITENSKFICKFLVTTASANSYYLAKSLGYLKEDYALLHVKGNYYEYPLVLRSKVYRPQIEKIPFIAVHADPNPFISNPMLEFGPTTEINLSKELEKDFDLDFLVEELLSNVKLMSVILNILNDRETSRFIFKNLLYKIPIIGKEIFAQEARKLLPSINARKLVYRRGGVRPQLVDLKAKKLILGEKIFEFGNMVFCITPSPGASAAMLNAFEICRKIHTSLDLKFYLDKYSRFFNISDDSLYKMVV